MLFDRQMLLLAFLFCADQCVARVIHVPSVIPVNPSHLDLPSPSTAAATVVPVAVNLQGEDSLLEHAVGKRQTLGTTDESPANKGVLESIASVVESFIDGPSSSVADAPTTASRRSTGSSASSSATPQNALDVFISAVSEEVLGAITSSQSQTRTSSRPDTTKTKTHSDTTTSSGTRRPTETRTGTPEPSDPSRPSGRPSGEPGRPTGPPQTSPATSTTPTSTTDGATSITVASTPSSSSADQLPPPVDPQEQDRRGRVAGIATGTVAGVALLGLAAAILVRRQMQKKSSAGEKKGVYPEVAWLYDPAPTPSRPGSVQSGHSRNSSFASASEELLHPSRLYDADDAAERRASAAPEVLPSLVEGEGDERPSRSTWPSGREHSAAPLLAPIPAIASRESSPVSYRASSPGGSPTSRYSRRPSRSRSSLDVGRRPLSAVVEEPLRSIPRN